MLLAKNLGEIILESSLTRVPYSRVKFFVTVCENTRHLERFFRNYGLARTLMSGLPKKPARATPSSIDRPSFSILIKVVTLQFTLLQINFRVKIKRERQK